MEDFWMEHRYSSCCYQLEPHYEHTYQLVKNSMKCQKAG